MSDAPVISKNLPYADVAGKTMGVETFTQMSSCCDGVVKSKSASIPHGLLGVRLEGFDENPLLPIYHTIDYRNAYELWEIAKKNEDDYTLMVEVVPVKGLLKRLIMCTQPKLRFTLYDGYRVIECRYSLYRGDEALCR
jgi:hypothetical protein